MLGFEEMQGNAEDAIPVLTLPGGRNNSLPRFRDDGEFTERVGQAERISSWHRFD